MNWPLDYIFYEYFKSSPKCLRFKKLLRDIGLDTRMQYKCVKKFDWRILYAIYFYALFTDYPFLSPYYNRKCVGKSFLPMK